MLFSTHFNITRTVDDDWFDPILDADTRLFVDPFLVFKDAVPHWAQAFETLIQHFDRVFQLIAESDSKPASLAYRKALRLLLFREPCELCLGYTSEGTGGLGSAEGFAEVIGEAITAAIARGLKNPRHFEELGILNEGIGRDRISDITCTVLKRQLVLYTQSVAQRQGIPLRRHRLYAAAFDSVRQQWERPEVDLPTNPVTGGPVLLVPVRFLRELPTLNADDWWTNYEDQRLREDLNYEIMGKVSKSRIIEVARAHPEAVRQWTERKEAEAATSYDLQKDPRGVYQWDQAAASFVAANPVVLQSPANLDEFLAIVTKVCELYKHFIEEEGGWKLLWDDNYHDKSEEAAQLTFRGIARSYCAANNIVLDGEVNLGRGPVDFKFSNGYQQRALLEVKKLDNGKFWNGLGAAPIRWRVEGLDHTQGRAGELEARRGSSSPSVARIERASVAGWEAVRAT